jgi:hypothetical protein
MIPKRSCANEKPLRIGVKSQPLFNWPAGLRLARFFTAVH